ncbi:MAG: recombinase family protein [Deinococcus sp.]|uniref:recombinase family protein n=1 Tax=Deinococcus sp. TaxID=47478 RepID=UPI0026DA754D|nr:recombinase family protein [Deinococcus sp.]MDO4246863.1 recombinase family protein [Deinococcus sp.]
MTRAAIYTRVSTEEQTENYSLEAQASILKAFADQQGSVVVAEYVDAGQSGTKLERPALTRLLADAQAKQFDTVLIYRLDRLARRTHLAYSIIQQLADCGAGVRSYSEPQIDSTTPMGKVALGVTAIFAELERDTFLQRSKDGMRKAVEKGYYTGGIVAYGYKVEDRRLVIHEEEAEVIRMIFGWCVERRWSNIKIAAELTRLNIPPRYRRDGRGIRGVATAHWWRAGGVLRILKNTSYKGEYRYGKRGGLADKGEARITAAACPQIISPEVWEEAQKVLASNRLTALRNAKNVYMLKSLMKCGNCGCTYVGTRGSKWAGYRCGGRSNRASIPKATGPCTNPNIPMASIEGPIWERICSIINDPEHHLDQRPLSIIPAELPHAEKALAQAQASRSRLTDLYLDPVAGMSKTDYLSRAATLDTQIAELQKRVNVLSDKAQQQADAQAQAESLRALAERYRDLLTDADDLTRQQLAHALVRRITVQKDGSVDVEWAV